MAETTVALLYGYREHRKSPWVQDTAGQFEEAGFKVIIPRMPNKGIITRKQADEALAQATDHIENLVLVGKSCHARTALHAAERRPLEGLGLVAGFLETIDPTDDPRLKDWVEFYSHRLRFKAISENAPITLGLYSPDDPEVPYTQVPVVAERLHGMVHIVRNRGHFSEGPLPLNLAERLVRLGVRPNPKSPGS